MAQQQFIVTPNVTKHSDAQDVINSNATDAESRLGDLEAGKNYLGYYPDSSAADAAHPVKAEGDYFIQDNGGGSAASIYVWDNSDSAWVVIGQNPNAATESVGGTVTLATAGEVDNGWLHEGEEVVRAKHLRVKEEGGGIVLKGFTDPTVDGANTGADSLISGKNNELNSGSSCSISGFYNDNNSGSYCNISGSSNYHNSGDYCLIGGIGNGFNNGGNCLISGEFNYYNFGSDCIISGYNLGSFIQVVNATGEADDDKITKTGHGLEDGDPFRFTSLTGGSGEFSLNLTYYVVNKTVNDFQVAATVGGSPIAIGVDFTDMDFVARGVNYGNWTSISGKDNYYSSGGYCNITGKANHSNSGNYCSISGQGNFKNSGYACVIGGEINQNNSGSYCSISGSSNYSNSGHNCSISGNYNNNNSGSLCSISGFGNSYNSGNYCSISGQGNNNNTGIWCLISGNNNNTNSGSYCSIGGGGNISNSGRYCSISGHGNEYNSGDYSLISGDRNGSNSGDYCQISGKENKNNSGDYCLISGYKNQYNFGSRSIISGYGVGVAEIVTSGATATDAGDKILKTGHDLSDGVPLKFTSLSGGAGLNLVSTYYVINKTTNDFQVATSVGGSVVNITTDYTDVQYVAKAINYGSYCNISGLGNYSSSGNGSAISGESNHSNSGDYCSISGYANHSNSGAGCSISGYSNSGNSGNESIISGGANGNNSGTYCVISGYSANNNTLDYARVHGGGVNARIIDVVAKANTSDDSGTILTLGGGVESPDNRINIPADTAWLFTVNLIAKDSTTTKLQSWTRQGMIFNDGTDTTLDGLVGIGADRDFGSLGATMAITADNTNKALQIEATGVAATNINWAASIQITQVG